VQQHSLNFIRHESRTIPALLEETTEIRSAKRVTDVRFGLMNPSSEERVMMW
jgi:hypothetical protein